MDFKYLDIKLTFYFSEKIQQLDTYNYDFEVLLLCEQNTINIMKQFL